MWRYRMESNLGAALKAAREAAFRAWAADNGPAFTSKQDEADARKQYAELPYEVQRKFYVRPTKEMLT
jgi:hypothetical protein